MTITEQVQAIREINPNATASTMARTLGVSKQHVSKLLSDLRLPTTVSIIRPCKSCEEPLERTARSYCSNTCSAAARRLGQVELSCAQCETLFLKSRAQYRYAQKHGQTNYFCSISCRGMFMSEHPHAGRKGHGHRIFAMTKSLAVIIPVKVRRELGLHRQSPWALESFEGRTITITFGEDDASV